MLMRYFLAIVLVFQESLATPLGLDPRITDGVNAAPGEFPYLVSVHWGVPPFIEFSHACGGSILNENYILTAGHCVSLSGSFKILAGKHNIKENEPMQQDIEVEEIIVHEDFKEDNAEHDIALLKLRTPLILNVLKRAMPVSLPIQNEKRTGQAVLAGWGSIAKSVFPEFPSILQKATVPLLDHAKCEKKFPKFFDTQICTDAVGDISACPGDSGGPLVQSENNVPIQIGIVMMPVYACGMGPAPYRYTRVASYVDWIYNNMK